MDGTSLPHIIHVHEQMVDSPKTPTMIDYKLDESMKQSLGNGFDKNKVKEKEKLTTKKRFNVILPLKGETYQYPRIRVEDEEGISVHSFSESVRDNDSSNDDGDNLDHSVTQRSVTQSFMENVHQEDFKSTTELRKGVILEESGLDDTKSFNSNITDMVRYFSFILHTMLHPINYVFSQ